MKAYILKKPRGNVRPNGNGKMAVRDIRVHYGNGPAIGRNPDARAKARLAKHRERVAVNRGLRTLNPDAVAKLGVGLSRRNNLVKLYDV
jgi:hypothetical protein